MLVVVLLGGGVVAVWRLGGLEPVVLAKDEVQPGQIIEVNGVELTFLRASVVRSSFDTDTVRVEVEATCRNTTDTGVQSLLWFRHAVLIQEPSSRQASTDENYVLDLPPFSWRGLNPTSTPIPCKVSADFDDFTSAGYVNVAVVPARQSPNQFTPLDYGRWELGAYHWKVVRVPLVDTP